MQRYCFTGDIKKLKGIGYKFERLFARNYKSYSKDRITMFVISKMQLELSMIEMKFQIPFIEFILKNKDEPESFWKMDCVFGKTIMEDMPVYCVGCLGVMKVDDFDDLKYKNFTSKIHKVYQQRRESKITEVEQKELVKKIREENQEYINDGITFGFELVQSIIELNNLHPLEIKEI